MSWIRRVLAAAIVAVLLALGSQSAHAESAPADSDLVHGFEYDAHVLPNVVTDGAAERGPPANLASCTLTPAVDPWSYGRLARLDGGAPVVGYPHYVPTSLAQSDKASPTTSGTVQVTDGGLSSLQFCLVAANAGSGAVRGVDDVLGGLAKGKQSFVRTVPDEAALTRTFDNLAQGGSPTTWKNFDGTVIARGDGVQVGLRSSSRSGGSTIDIRMPDGKIYKIHVE